MKSLSSQTQRTLFNLLLKLQPVSSRSEGGYIIVVVAAMIVAVSGMLLAGELVSRVDNNSTKASGNSTAGFYAAEAGLNLRAKAIKSTFEGYNVPSGTSPSSGNACRSSSNVGTGDFICDNSLSVQDYLYPNDPTKRIPVSTYVIDANAKNSSGVPQPSSITIEPGELFSGLNALEYRYDVASTAFDSINNPTAFLSIRFKSRLVPLFQFAAFYDKDLEILPSPTMTLSGPVHTNGDLYLVSDGGGSTLTLNGQTSVRRNLYRGRKNNNSCGAGTVRAFNGSGTTIMNCGSSRVQITNVSPWNNQVRINVPAVTVPPPEALDPIPTSNYWSKADLRIVLRLNSSNAPTGIEVRNVNGSVDTGRTSRLMNSCSIPNTTLRDEGSSDANYEANDVSLNVNSTSDFQAGDIVQIGNDFDSNVISSISSNSITIRRQLGHSSYQSGTIASAGSTVRKSVVSTSDTMYNYREGKYIRMLNVDVRELLNCIHAHDLQDSSKTLNDTTEGGLVWYFTVDGPDSGRNVYSAGNTPTDGNNYGVRLYNAGILQASVSGAPEIQGLTIVSDQAVYTAGEYNCGTWDASTNTCSYKKPASILADSINVLSNSWQMDDRGTTSYSNNLPATSPNVSAQGASNTRINAAFLAGTDTTGRQEGTSGQADPYNGGLENYPRFHENWSGLTLRYRGSFVSLNRPRKVDGVWSSSRYSPPIRAWDYDTDFNNAANLPPLSPRFVYLRQERFSRDYNRSASIGLPNAIASLASSTFFSIMPSSKGMLFKF
ncbi:MAG: hypothetical protein MH252_22180 [Thermosynechococcaceae cyanobacterium MS004]|nr:hypothetical protein [Thermosynechococcaceae cyanobacterium MS004]